MSIPNPEPVQDNYLESALSAAWESSGVIMIILSADHKILEFNQEAERAYGVKREKVLGKDYFQQFLPEEIWADVSIEMAKVLAGQTTVGFENSIRSKEGKERLISWSASRFLDPQGQTCGTIAFGFDITKQRMAEDKLASQEKMYRTLVNTIPHAIWTADSEGKARFFNKAWKDLTGRESEESLGDKWAELVHPDDARELLAKWEHAYKYGEPYEGECRLKIKDGSYTTIAFSGTPVKDASGKIYSWVGINIDLSKRQHAEADLLESEARFRKLLEAVDLIAIILDDQGNILFANEYLCQITGWSREDLAGKSWFDVFIPPEKRADIVTVFNKVASAGDPTHYENEIMTKSGEKRLVRFSNIYLRDRSGNLVGASIGEDVTESRRAESALRESHGLLHAITEGTSDAIYVKDKEHRYLFVNSVAAKGLGYKKKEIIGRSDKELLPPELVRIIAENDNQVLEDGRLRVLEEKVAGRIWSVKKWPLRDANRKNTGIIGISRDITELKRNQELSNALNRINTSITSTLDFDEIIRRAIKEASQAIDCESGALILRDEGYWLIKHMYKLGEDKIGARLDDEKAKHLVHVEETKKVLVVDDCREDKRVDQELMKSLGIRSFLAVPLIKKDRLIGVLAFHYLSSPGSFGEPEIDFAGKVASSVALAIENAQLYFDQRNIANTLQETFLTVPKEIKGLDIGHIYKSASEIAKVGGDFFDLFELENNKVCVLIGDVSGKGLEAATMTSMLKNTIHAYAHEVGSPAEILKKTNNSACGITQTGSFATIFLGVLDKISGELTYCNAGHPPQIVRRIAGRSAYLLTGNSPVGILKEFKYNDRTIVLEDSDVLFTFTDGLIEARRGNRFYGEKRLHTVVREHESIPAQDLPQTIFDHVLEFTGGKLSDDLAILCISPNRKDL